MRAIWITVTAMVIRCIRRFFANTPANKYERIVFSAVRDSATAFGKAYA
jgi:hypothetical protein